MFPLFRNSITGELIHDGSTQDTTLSRVSTSEYKFKKFFGFDFYNFLFNCSSLRIHKLWNVFEKCSRKIVTEFDTILAFWYILSALSKCQILACQTLHLSNLGYIFFIFLTFFALNWKVTQTSKITPKYRQCECVPSRLTGFVMLRKFLLVN